jgi:hypothetical protein
MPFLVTIFSSSYAVTQTKGGKQKKGKAETRMKKSIFLAVILGIVSYK